MAIVQISQITNRKGRAEDLPQLAGAELGWSTDTRQLWIGNGTLQDGAPVIGNTEILTEFSDILNLATSYTYKGTAAGYVVQTGPTPGDPVSQTLQSWMDQWASVKDFGATGDGLTDDTAAIQRALDQLYTIQTNPQTRRSLYFPAGKYLVSNTINIPTFATLYGEGPNNSIIFADTIPGSPFVIAQTADSLGQTGINIGNNGAIPPGDVTISDMSFQTVDQSVSGLLIQAAQSVHITNVNFIGPQTTSTITGNTPGTYAVSFLSNGMLLTRDVTFTNCLFKGFTYGAGTPYPLLSVSIINSQFDTLYNGVYLGQYTSTQSQPVTGISVTSCIFDNIYAEGVFFGENATLNASGYNVFYDVGNQFLGNSYPYYSIIIFSGANNVSIGDMFARSAASAAIVPWVQIGPNTIATNNGSWLSLSDYTINSSATATLTDNTSSGIAFTIDVTNIQTFKIEYTITRTGSSTYGNQYRTGTLVVTCQSGGTNPTSNAIYISDDYTDNSGTNPAITLGVAQNSNAVNITYNTTPAYGYDATMTYSIVYFS